MRPNYYDFYVRGRGEFPFDMLRYDECWPVEGYVVSSSPHAYLEHRTVKLRSHRPPTKDRWGSFLWACADTDVWK